jgi:hypothetical protein
MPSVAFVINRTLLRDPPGFLRQCHVAAKSRGWEPWFGHISEAENGLVLARRAVAAGARLVFAAGGDGTVRACAEALAHTGIPLAIVPIGTANLTAQALGVPARAGRAIEAGFDGRDRRIDLARVDGNCVDGNCVDGNCVDGASTDGTSTDGTSTDGTSTDGTSTDGTSTDGTSTDGTSTDGTSFTA